jgi:hypothetical protein
MMARWSGALAFVLSCAARRVYRACVFAYAGVRMLLAR